MSDRLTGHSSHPSITAKLDAGLEQLLSQPNQQHGGAVVHVEVPQQELLYSGAAGQARNGVAMMTATPFHWASIGKTLTATLLLQLWEQGYLGDEDLDATLELSLGELNVLPESIVARLHERQGVSRGAQITLRQLLTHTSGMRDAMQDSPELRGADADGLAPGSLIHYLFHDEDVRARTVNPLPAWNETAGVGERFAGIINFYCYENRYARAALFNPGAAFSYSDTGFVLLALIIERLSGKPLEVTLDEQIFKPLALQNTYLAYRSDPELGPAREPEAEVYFGDVPCFASGRNLSFDWGGGGIVSPAAALVKFLRALFAGELFQQSQTLAAMTDWQCPQGLQTPRTGVGLGLFRTEYAGGELWGHSGAWGAKMFWDPARNIYLGGTINQALGAPDWHYRFFEIE